jgi:site-specific recombinase XerC
LLGHNNIKTTEIYLHLSTQSLVDSIELADMYIAKALQGNKELKLEMAV